MKRLRQRFREVGVRDGVWAGSVQRSAGSAIFRCEDKQADEIVNMYPGHPLFTIAESAAEAEAKRCEHFGERAALASKNRSGPDGGNSEAEFARA